MTDFLIRNVPTDIYARLKRSAQANRRSIGKEALIILEREIDFAMGIEAFVAKKRPAKRKR